jgi:hypothetical protein
MREDRMGKSVSRLQHSVRTRLKPLRDLVVAIAYCGKARWCPVCGKWSRRFRAFGKIRRRDAKCPHCGSLERHRFVWLYFTEKTDLFDERAKKMLHVAPEEWFAPRIKKRLGKGYITADLMDRRAMVKMDVTDIKYPDETFDVIYCSHVLEHVQDDRRAMREFFRVLKRGGWAILIVPIDADKTIEDPSIVDPAERLRVFGQEDHVRRYGPDYVDRLRDAGFAVTVQRVADLAEGDRATRMGLTPASGAIFHCTKA